MAVLIKTLSEFTLFQTSQYKLERGFHPGKNYNRINHNYNKILKADGYQLS